MSLLPGITTQRKPKKMAFDDVQMSALVYGDPIVIESGQVDSGNSVRTTVLRPGNVVIKKAGSTKFVLANDFANADQGTVAAITSAQVVDAGWDLMVLELFRDGVKVAEVTGGAADDTAAEWVTLINADAEFSAHVTPSDSGGSLVLTDKLGVGAIRVEASINDAYGTVFNTTQSYSEAINTPPDVRVILEEVDMLDASGNADDGFCAENAWAGSFRIADLINGGTDGAISASARGLLERRGSKFAS